MTSEDQAKFIEKIDISDDIETYGSEISEGYKPDDDNANMDNLLDKMILPWPLKRIEAPVDGNNFGEVKLTKQGELLRTYIGFTDFMNDMIQIYDSHIELFLKNIYDTAIDLPNNRVLRFEANNINPTLDVMDTSESKKMWPIHAREQNVTYAADIRLTAKIMQKYSDDKGNIYEQLVEGEIKTVGMGKIPAMLGSKMDNLRGLSKEEQIEHGECPNDVKGYFIIDGKEYVIISQDMLASNRVIIYPDDDLYLGRVTSVNKYNKSTKVIMTYRDPKKYIYKSWIGFGNSKKYKDNSFNIFQIFRLLGKNHPDEIMRYILYFSKPHLYTKIKNELAPTLLDYQLHIDTMDIYEDIAKTKSEIINEESVEKYKYEVYNNLFASHNDNKKIPYIYRDQYGNEMIEYIWGGKVYYIYKSESVTLENLIEYTTGYLITRGSDNVWRYAMRETGENIIIDVKKRYILDSPKYKNIIFKKLCSFSIMINKVLEVNFGERYPDDRDNWSIKMVKSAGMFIYQTLNKKWNNIVGRIENDIISTTKTIQDDIKITSISLSDISITDLFIKSFKTNWNTGKFNKDEKITDILSRQSLISAYAYIRRVSSKGSRESINLANRSVKGSQYGFIDAIDTSEGKNCGLVVALSIGCFISNRRDPDQILYVLKSNKLYGEYENIYNSKTGEDNKIIYNDALIINGEFIGFCIGPDLEKLAINLQRDGVIPFDVTILYLDRDNILYVESGVGRPTRPLLLVNTETRRLVLDEKIESGELNSEDIKNFQLLMDHGCIEYVCPWKQEYILLAQSINDLKSYKYEIENTEKILKNAEELLDQNSDPRYLSIYSKKLSIMLSRDEYIKEIDESIVTLNENKENINKAINTESMDLTVKLNEYEEYKNNKNELIAEKLNINVKDIEVYKKTSEYETQVRQVTYELADMRADLLKYVELIEENLVKYQKNIKKINEEIKSMEKKKIENKPILNKYYEDQVNNIKIKLSTLKSKKNYTHCELNPNSLMSVSSSIIPLADHNQAPRNTFVCNMERQASSIYHSNHRWRFDKTARILAWPSRPAFETEMNKMYGFDKMGRGEMTIFAIASFLNYVEEDALIINENSLERGAFVSVTYKTIENIIDNSSRKTKNLIIKEEYTANFPRKTNRDQSIYVNLDENGIVKIGSSVNVGDCIIGKKKTIIDNSQGGSTKTEDSSIYVKMGESGIVSLALVTKNIVKIKIRQVTLPIPGDKFATVHGQKSTIAKTLKDSQMPFVESTGTTPTIIMNPHAIPSRMTLGQLNEVVVSKYGAMAGERINASSYNEFNIDEYKRSLVENYGYNEWGWETMVNRLTGERFKAQIFIGPTFYQRLKHNVRDKAQVRGKGIRDEFSRQPPGGRSRGGALRNGEMERDVYISHGASAVMQDVYKNCSDKYPCIMCNNCHNIIYMDRNKEPFCTNCKETDFGKIDLPYSYMIMNRFLMASDINMSLVTEKVKK